MEMTKMGEKQRASLNQLLQIFREEKSSSICYLKCLMANIQYLQHVDNQTSRLHLEGDKSSDIPHMIKMLASPRPDGQQRVIFVNLRGHLKKELFKAIKKVQHIYVDQKIVSKKSSGIQRLNPTCTTTILSQFLYI
jgi:hypothetical protein